MEHPAMLNYQRLQRERHRLTCKRLILTHVGGELQARITEATEEVASDGLTLRL
jgi:hypothetical protein